jgi:glycosyltransferase involved in cell wall biosynthesis
MKVSIIIPMYNEQYYISRCLESLKIQTYKDFEIILIDDWSTDNTINEAEKFLKNFNLTILNQKHGWPWKARNWWSLVAKWEIFVFVDADMYFDKDYIKNLIKPIIDWKEQWTSHGSELVWNLNNAIARAYWINRWRIFEDWEKTWVYRAIKKDIFIKSWWYEDDKYAFEDNFVPKIGYASFVKNAICYHNNPESIFEIFKHEIWIWESLIAKWTIKEYLNKYKNWIIIFIIISLIFTAYAIIKWLFLILPLILFLIILFLIILKTIQRIIKEKYLSHLIFIPIVMLTRWFWYFTWIIKFFIKLN